MKLAKQLTLLLLFAKAEDFKTFEIGIHRNLTVSEDSTIDIANSMNSVYTGDLYFGGSKKNSKHSPEPLKMIFDSGSPTMWV
jgi:hypothetical protein